MRYLSILLIGGVVALSGCAQTAEPEADPNAYQPTNASDVVRGCTDGFGPIQAGTTICVGYSG